MTWILLLAIMSGGQSSMTTIEFSDQKSCYIAGKQLKDKVNRMTPLFSGHIKYSCIQLTGVK